MQYDVHQFKNYGFLTYKLTDEQIDFIWKRVERAKKKHDIVNKNLAGNISLSLDMGLDNVEPIIEIVFPLCQEYERQFGQYYHNQVAGEIKKKLSLNDWWVNYQYQNEFNPLHKHGGLYSWVIWMKIPTESEDQNLLPIAANSNALNKISNFQFTYTNTLGEVTDLPVEMNKAKEGTLAFFPAQMKHCVYPFYNSDEPRITVAGNVSMYTLPNNEKK